MRQFRKTLFLFLAVVALTFPAWAWQGKVVGVTDGDTITVMHDGKGEVIRLYGVDCPEKHQDYGQKAKEFTSSKVFGKVIDVEPVTRDRYGRIIGLVSFDGQSLDHKIIEAGYGWVYLQYCQRSVCEEWKKLEDHARSAKLGLWAVSSPVPPWEFRHGRQSIKSAAAGKSQTGNVARSIAYHGNVSSRIFHAPHCRYYNCKNCTAVFKSREEAIQAGHRPCKVCNP